MDTTPTSRTMRARILRQISDMLDQADSRSVKGRAKNKPYADRISRHELMYKTGGSVFFFLTADGSKNGEVEWNGYLTVETSSKNDWSPWAVSGYIRDLHNWRRRTADYRLNRPMRSPHWGNKPMNSTHQGKRMYNLTSQTRRRKWNKKKKKQQTITR